MTPDTTLAVAVSGHFASRAAQRGLPPRLLPFILTYGTEFPTNGAVSLTVLERDLPPELRDHPDVELTKDWVVVLAQGTLLTCYYRARASTFLRRKNKLPSWARPCRPRTFRPQS
jgi:hypothetical protein